MIDSQTTLELDPACDFIEHLSQRMGMKYDSAERILAGWIAEYEPKARRRIAALSPVDHPAVPGNALDLALSRVA